MARNMTQRGKVDLEGLHGPEVQAIKAIQPPADVPFRIGNMGHAVLVVRDIDASLRFYTQVLGFKVSDVYPEEHGAGPDGVHAFQPGPPRPRPHRPGQRARLPRAGNCTTWRSRSPPSTTSSAPGTTSRSTACPSTSTAAGGPAARCPSSSATPTATAWRFSGDSTRWTGTARHARPRTGRRDPRSKRRWTKRRRDRTPPLPIRDCAGVSEAATRRFVRAPRSPAISPC